ncbi:MAG: hypothetical protein ACUVS7_07005 [Bryobacteraceae bacterium]
MEDRFGWEGRVDFENTTLKLGEGRGAAAPGGGRIFAPEVGIEQETAMALASQREGEVLRSLEAVMPVRHGEEEDVRMG